MQDPARDVAGVVKGLIESPTADEQAAVMQRYFVPRASFDHPLCAVASTAYSRDWGVLPIYQWLKCMFRSGPNLIAVHSVAYDQSHNRIYIDADQHLICRIPFIRAVYTPWCRYVPDPHRPSHSRPIAAGTVPPLSHDHDRRLSTDALWCSIVTVLHLTKEHDGLWYITRQEDIYPSQVMPGAIIPGLPTVIVLIKLALGLLCLFLTLFAQMFLGVWKTSKKTQQSIVQELQHAPVDDLLPHKPVDQLRGDKPPELLYAGEG